MSMKRMSGLLMLLVAAGIVVGCSSLDKVKPIIDDAKDIIDQVDGDKPTPPPAPVPPAPNPVKLHPRNNPAQKPEWNEAAGAPDALVEGKSYGFQWDKEGDGPRGVWTFEYRENGAPGLYKPHEWDIDGKRIQNNRLLLLKRNPTNGQGMRPEHIGQAYHADVSALDVPVAWLTWADKTPLGGKPIDGSQIGRAWGAEEWKLYMFGDAVKLRSAKPPAQGMAIVVTDIYGQRLFAWVPTDIHCREDR
jgi:hypothetical protein